MELSRLYFESCDLVLAKPILEKLLIVGRDSAEVNFYLGSIAAQQTEYEKADNYFQRAVDLDAGFEKRIKDLRQRLGDEYFGYANFFQNKDRNTFKRLLLKGLRYCGDHTKIEKELTALALEDLKKIKTALESDPPKYEDALIRSWHKEFEENKNLSSCLNPDQIADFCRFYGNLLVSEKDFAGAVESFDKALSFSSNNADLHIFITDVLFAQGAVERGVIHLNKAVEINRTYAQHWEDLGDNLQTAGQINDAVSAYEQCFMALPENVGLLKKMGDCYLVLGQPEAAHEAYEQLKCKLVELGDRPNQKESGERTISTADVSTAD